MDLVNSNRLMDFTHTWTKGKGWQKKNPVYIPTAEEVNTWSLRGMGHDAINQWICVETRAKRLGVYGKCEYCKGVGNLWLKPEYKKMANEWEKTEPPAGNWYQVWETTSEGSPISPSFQTPEELATWLVENNASTFGYETTTYDNWLNFIKGSGWALTMVIQNGVIKSGVDALQEK